MTTTGPLPIHRRDCPGDDVTTRLAAMPRLRVLIRTCQPCGAVALQRIHDGDREDRPLTDEQETYSATMRAAWRRMTPEARAKLRTMHGQVVRLHNDELREDVDGRPLGVERVDQGGGTLVLPRAWLEDGEEDGGSSSRPDPC